MPCGLRTAVRTAAAAARRDRPGGMPLPADDAETPTELRLPLGSIRLKWHKLRRRLDDAPFDRRNLALGLAAGASLEVDLQPLACGRFVCLHDAELQSETDGVGPVAAIDGEAVKRLRLREGGAAPLLLDELVGLVRAGPTHPAARVQLDLQPTATPMSGRWRAGFEAALGARGEPFVLSGYDWDAVSRLGGGVTGLALGYDPSRRVRDGVDDVVALVRQHAPEAQTLYLHFSIVRRSQQRGDALVRRLADLGHRVDCWTLDHGRTDATHNLLAAVAAGCHEVTTNTPLAWLAEPALTT